MKKTALSFFLMLLFGIGLPAIAQIDRAPSDIDRSLNRRKDSRELIRAYDRADVAANLFRSIMESPSGTIPVDVINHAEAIAVFPSTTQFRPLIGEEPVGLVSIRDLQTGQWGPPIFIRLEGKGIKDQLRREKGSLILLGMNRRAAEAFLIDDFRPGKYSAENADFISYLVRNGSITEIPIAGSRIVHDRAVNEAVYEERVIRRFLPVSRQISTRVLIFTETLNRYVKGRGV